MNLNDVFLLHDIFFLTVVLINDLPHIIDLSPRVLQCRFSTRSWYTDCKHEQAEVIQNKPLTLFYPLKKTKLLCFYI